MSEVSDLIKEELIFMNFQADSIESLFTEVGKKLHELGYVKETYIPAIIQREKDFPTGLALENFNVAIPHTDTIHIEKPFVAVVRNQSTIPFIHMGTADMKIDIDFFFFLGIKEAHGQVDLLQTLMDRFNNKEFVQSIKDASNKSNLYSYLKSNYRRNTG